MILVGDRFTIVAIATADWREGEAPAEPQTTGDSRLGRSLALPLSLRGLAVSVMLLACALLAAGADTPRKPALPDDVYPELAAQSARLIEESLAGEPTRRAAEKARVAALMLAEFAQQNLVGPDAGRRATVRDAGLHIAGMIKEKKYPAAIEQAKRLPKLMANPTAKTERIKLVGTHMEIDELMGQFRGAKLGGLGIEAQLDKLAASKGDEVPRGDLTDDLRLIAFRTAVAAELTQDHKPTMKGDEWLLHAAEMRTASLELANAVAAKNGKTAFAAVERLNNSCNKCHLKFRQ